MAFQEYELNDTLVKSIDITESRSKVIITIYSDEFIDGNEFEEYTFSGVKNLTIENLQGDNGDEIVEGKLFEEGGVSFFKLLGLSGHSGESWNMKFSFDNVSKVTF